MSKGYFITGTDTGIGKTRSALAIMAALQQSGLSVCGMKPVSAGCTTTEEGSVNEDALRLIEQSSIKIPYKTVNPYAWQPAIAPHIAAAQSGVEMSLSLIVDTYEHIAAQCDAVIVEGAGGWLVPLNDHQTMADVAIELSLEIILVVGIRLGCINHALLTAENVHQSGCKLAGWIANHICESMIGAEENVQYLSDHIEAPLLAQFAFEKSKSTEELAENLSINCLLNKTSK